MPITRGNGSRPGGETIAAVHAALGETGPEEEHAGAKVAQVATVGNVAAHPNIVVQDQIAVANRGVTGEANAANSEAVRVSAGRHRHRCPRSIWS